MDLGWVSQLESKGVYWIDESGNKADPIEALKAMGANAVRLRVFVNPPKDAYWRKPQKEVGGRRIGGEECMLGFCDKESVLEMAKRVKSHDLGLMIDFHYSDYFADSVFQDIPKEWENDSFGEMTDRVAQHTKEVLGLLGAHDIYPDWVQVGNEINPGILLPMGSITENPAQLIAFLNEGYKAVKACCPACSVITHIAEGHDYNLCTRFFDVFFAYGGQTDIMGLSYYPYWARITHDEEKLQDDMARLVEKYKKPLMLCEIGGPENEEEETYQMLAGAVRAVKAVPDRQGLGIFYWEPEVGASLLPDHYILGAARLVKENCLQFTKVMGAYADNR